MRADEPVMTAPFFIVGSGRSGSTVLRMMLASHSRIAIPPETWFLLPLVKKFSIECSLDAAEIESALAIIIGHDRWRDMKLDADEFQSEVSQLSLPHIGDLAEVVYRLHMKAEGKARWGDKTPPYIEILPDLARIFPHSRFIHLVRDGRDVAKSFQATGWFGGWLHDNSREWTQALKWHWRWFHSELRERILEIRYEEL